LSVVPAVSANVVIGQSIAGVKLGDSPAQVRAALRSQSHEEPQLDHGELWYSGFLRVFFTHNRVTQVLAYSKKQKTDKGITIGSSRAQLKRAYSKAKCAEGHTPVYLYCVMAGHAQGRKSYTGFLFEARGGVVEIELGYGSVAAALQNP